MNVVLISIYILFLFHFLYVLFSLLIWMSFFPSFLTVSLFLFSQLWWYIQLSILSKIVIRRLPPSLTKEELEEQLQPLPEMDYLEFFSSDTRSFNKNMFSYFKKKHAIIDSKHVTDIITLSFQPFPTPLCKGLHKLQAPRGYSSLQRSIWWLCVHWQQRYEAHTFFPLILRISPTWLEVSPHLFLNRTGVYCRRGICPFSKDCQEKK